MSLSILATANEKKSCSRGGAEDGGDGTGVCLGSRGEESPFSKALLAFCPSEQERPAVWHFNEACRVGRGGLAEHLDEGGVSVEPFRYRREAMDDHGGVTGVEPLRLDQGRYGSVEQLVVDMARTAFEAQPRAEVIETLGPAGRYAAYRQGSGTQL